MTGGDRLHDGSARLPFAPARRKDCAFANPRAAGMTSRFLRGRRIDARDLTMHKLLRNPRFLLAGALLVGAAALGGCETTGTGVAQAAAKPAEEPMTHTQAAEICWMATEHGHADMSLDKRADIVDQCIKDKMAGKTWTPPGAKQAAAKKP
jgi:hypothetical protein